MTSWNRPHDGPRPDDPTDGWGWGTNPATGQPLPRPHDRHWAPGTLLDGLPAPKCWCEDAIPRATQAPERPKRGRAAKDTPPPSPEAPADLATQPEPDRTFLTRLLVNRLGKLNQRTP